LATDKRRHNSGSTRKTKRVHRAQEPSSLENLGP
jgi:hypothetical protein